jgi:ABC-2 type transport system permease protein
MRYEILKTLHSTGYVIVSYILPIAVVLALVGIRFFQERFGMQRPEISSGAGQFANQIEGYVDQSGLIRFIPEEIPPGYLVHFENEALAQQALEDGEITAYYVVPPDILSRGEAYYVYPDARSYLEDGQSWVMAWTIMVNLMGGDAELVDRVWNPIEGVMATDLSPQAAGGEMPGEACSRPGIACESNDLVRYMPSIIAVLFFFVFMTGSSRLFDSIGVEKENRVIEVLMLSISPRQLLAGKLLGLGIAGLLQTFLWSGALYFGFNLDDSLFNLPEEFVFPAGILIASLVFFLGGYGLYASLMAGAGALVPKMKEAGAANYIVIFPLFIGYAFSVIAPLAKMADSAFLVFLSIFPLTSPLVMIMRLTNGAVPTWQLVLSIGLLFGSAFYTLRAAAAMFQAQNLLSGQPFSLRRYLEILVSCGRYAGQATRSSKSLL